MGKKSAVQEILDQTKALLVQIEEFEKECQAMLERDTQRQTKEEKDG